MDHFTEEEEEIVNRFFRNNSFYFVTSEKMELCQSCKGLGFTSREELTDYHRGDYSTFHDKCKVCDADGRVIVRKFEISFKGSYEKKETIALSKYNKDPFNGAHTSSKRFSAVVDERDWKLEQDNPKLAKLNYNNYNKLAKELRMIEKLKK